MSILKDLVFVILFLFVVIKYIVLYNSMKKQRSYFIDTLSHDLRVSTIAQIRGLDFLQKNPHLISNSEDLIEDINNSCKFTLDMMTMLLNSYRFESGEQVLNYKTLSMLDLVHRTAQELLSESEKKGIKIYYKTLGEADVCADRDLITKLLILLLSTAINNAYANSVIEIFMTSSDDKCRIDISYEGIQLTEEECRRMFSEKPRFSTVGHGIKMHLCKKIVDFHNGDIFVKKITSDRVSFAFSIPRRKKDVNTKSLALLPLQTYKF